MMYISILRTKKEISRIVSCRERKTQWRGLIGEFCKQKWMTESVDRRTSQLI